MNKIKKNISAIVKNNLCTGCGVCENICDGAISMHRVEGEFRPKVDNSRCTLCGLCCNVCGGESIELATRAKALFDDVNIKDDYYIGKYISTYTGYSNDYNTRIHSASGGVLSQFLIFLLERSIIQGAIVVRFDSVNPTEPDVFLAKMKDEILVAQSSKYCPVSFHGVIDEVLKEDGKFVVVGLPCHIHSLRKYEDVRSNLREKIVGYFGLYCSSTRTMLSQDYLFKKYNIKKNSIKSFAYRDDGCMGFLKTVNKKGEITKIPLNQYWPSMRGFFTPSRCTFCADHYAELADISFGDIQVDEFIKDEIGIGSLISRSKYWDRLLRRAKEEGALTLKSISACIINNSQLYGRTYKKGPGLKSAFFIMKLLGKKIPQYETQIKAGASIKFIIRYFVHVIERRIGKIRNLWWLIEPMDKFALFMRLGIMREKRK